MYPTLRDHRTGEELTGKDYEVAHLDYLDSLPPLPPVCSGCGDEFLRGFAKSCRVTGGTCRE